MNAFTAYIHILGSRPRAVGALLGAIVLLIAAPSAHAAKQPVDFFGGNGTEGGKFSSSIGGVAINTTGAGGVPAGTLYTVEGGSFDDAGARGNRIQRFERDDNGTPGDTTDDTYSWIAAWGTGVETGGSEYEICTVAASCGKGLGNGTNGSLNKPSQIAVDGDTGNVYVLDSSSRRTPDNDYRVNVYSATGAFLRSFGWDVVASGPGNTGTGYEICVQADGDVCKRGTKGAGIGQIGAAESGERAAEDIAVSPPDGNPTSGTVYVADSFNGRINTYGLDGSGPGSIEFESGSPGRVAVDSRGIVYASLGSGTETVRYDSQNANGGGVGFMAPLSPGVGQQSLGIDPDEDGVGPDTDVLYVGYFGGIRQFGPVNAPGLTAPPASFDATHGDNGVVKNFTAVATEPETGRIYAGANALSAGTGIYVLDETGPPPTASLDSLDNLTSTSVDLHATIDPNGPPNTSYRFEYRRDADASWTSTPLTFLGHQEDPQAIDITIDEAPAGLEPNTLYHFRVVAQRNLAPAVISNELTAETPAAPPIATTTGAPIRTTTTALLTGRVLARNSATTYRFEYGADTSYGQMTPAMPAGSGNVIQLVAEEVSGLEPNTTYHYRLVADNGTPGSPVHSEDVTVTTRGGEEPLSHAGFPGPPGSDRAWELVSMPDSNGNPLSFSYGFADSGDRAAYGIAGGTSISSSGSFFSIYLAERPAGAHPSSGWTSRLTTPLRDEVDDPSWIGFFGDTELSSNVSVNGLDAQAEQVVWRLNRAGAAQRLFGSKPPSNKLGGPISQPRTALLVSADSTRTVALLQGEQLDPAFPSAGSAENYYDISSGAPTLATLLPSDQPPACGVVFPARMQAVQPLSADGSRLYFVSSGSDCGSPPQLYLRDIPAAQTKLVSGPPLSGRSCQAGFVKGIEGAAFFATASRLTPDDLEPGDSCASGMDIYRYEEADGSLECVTCLAPGAAADIAADAFAPAQSVSVADDGSRVYFRALKPLRPGAKAGVLGTVYRLQLANGDLVALPPVRIGGTEADANLSHDGTLLGFTSDRPELNPLGGAADNGGTRQRYLYDDRDGSLTCVSCPLDGSEPFFGLSFGLNEAQGGDGNTYPNLRALADDGTFAFATSTPLIGADQNTPPPDPNPLNGDAFEAGTDVYEYRDGRLLLVTDGLTGWDTVPVFSGIDPSGRDVFFTAPARLTRDAIDSSIRLYDARRGGGIDLPRAVPPCPLEVCQGTPKGAPEEQEPSSANFSGPGNVAGSPPARCRKGKVRRKGRCVTRHPRRPQHKRAAQTRTANHDRRAAR